MKSPAGSCLVRSSLLEAHGFAHGFATRRGGVSAPPFDSMNLARVGGDRLEDVEENHRRLAAEAGYDVTRLAEVTQVHGARVVDADAFFDGLADLRREEADALIASRAGLAVGVRTADCVPILVADPRSGAVAAVHAGWRGAVANIVGQAVDAMIARDPAVSPSRLVAAIGPHIRGASFEVGDEVVAAVREAMRVAGGSEEGLVLEGSRPHVELSCLIRAQLRARGIAEAHIEDVAGDTFAEPARFHSYRRDGASSGRMLSVIVARADRARDA